MSRPWILHVVLLMSLGTSACWFHKARPAFTPPPPSAPSAPITTEPATAPPPEVPPPPDIKADPTASLPTIPPTVPEAPKPQPQRGKRASAQPAKPAVVPPPVEQTQPQPTSPPLRLGQIYTAEQAREYNRVLEESLERVRRALAAVNGRALTPDQSETLSRIRTFQRQAEQAREQDLVTAVNLARRADLLAQDLLARLQ